MKVESISKTTGQFETITQSLPFFSISFDIYLKNKRDMRPTYFLSAFVCLYLITGSSSSSLFPSLKHFYYNIWDSGENCVKGLRINKIDKQINFERSLEWATSKKMFWETIIDEMVETRGKFNLYFKEILASIEKRFILGGRLSTRL